MTQVRWIFKGLSFASATVITGQPTACEYVKAPLTGKQLQT